MRVLILSVLMLLNVLPSCQQSSTAVENTATARLTFFYTNDIMGYVTPCG